MHSASAEGVELEIAHPEVKSQSQSVFLSKGGGRFISKRTLTPCKLRPQIFPDTRLC